MAAEAIEGLKSAIAREKDRLARYEAGLRIIERIDGVSIERTEEIVADMRQSIALNEEALALLSDGGH